MEYADGKIIAEVKDGVGRITFNQPEKRNAMSIAMWDGMAAALEVFEHDAAVRCVVLTGAGDKAFVSGADISQFEKNRSDADAQREYGRKTGAGRDRLNNFPKPVIGEIRGFCMGGGLGIAMSCDIRIASSDSQFGIPAAKLGLGYGLQRAIPLVDLVGPAYAKEMFFTGRHFDAREARDMGLVNRVVADDKLEAAVEEMTRAIAENAPLTVRCAKLVVGEALKDSMTRDVAATERAVAACFNSQDYKEGQAAFMEKRKPRFTGT